MPFTPAPPDDEWPDGEYELWDDEIGVPIETFSNAERARHAYLSESRTVQDKMFIEGPDGVQYAYNYNRQPPGWDLL